jgi:hypothetical protein
VTERASFKRCRRQWNYGSFNGLSLTPIIPKQALELGSLVHATHAEWVDHPNLEPDDIFLTLANNRLDEIKATYLKQVGANISDEELGPTLDGIGLGHEMMGRYKERWGTPLPENFVSVQAEQEVVVPIPGTEHDCLACLGIGSHVDPCPECAGTGVTCHFLQGKLDGLVQDAKGRLFVLERKTYGMRPNPDALAVNDQFLAYMWILEQLDIGPVGGILYDGMWKRTAKQKPLEDCFLRIILTRSRAELSELGRELIGEAFDMDAANRDRRLLYKNRRWEGCYDCLFQDLCLAESRDEDIDHLMKYRYTQRNREDAKAYDSEPVA